jgi:hypothetical protein
MLLLGAIGRYGGDALRDMSGRRQLLTGQVVRAAASVPEGLLLQKLPCGPYDRISRSNGIPAKTANSLPIMSFLAVTGMFGGNAQ